MRSTAEGLFTLSITHLSSLQLKQQWAFFSLCKILARMQMPSVTLCSYTVAQITPRSAAVPVWGWQSICTSCWAVGTLSARVWVVIPLHGGGREGGEAKGGTNRARTTARRKDKRKDRRVRVKLGEDYKCCCHAIINITDLNLGQTCLPGAIQTYHLPPV